MGGVQPYAEIGARGTVREQCQQLFSAHKSPSLRTQDPCHFFMSPAAARKLLPMPLESRWLRHLLRLFAELGAYSTRLVNDP
jgi:hypothetical protein